MDGLNNLIFTARPPTIIYCTGIYIYHYSDNTEVYIHDDYGNLIIHNLVNGLFFMHETGDSK